MQLGLLLTLIVKNLKFHQKNTKHGNNFSYFVSLISLISFLFFSNIFAENDIVSSPLINLEELKPSFEETDNDSEKLVNENQIKQKKKYS